MMRVHSKNGVIVALPGSKSHERHKTSKTRTLLKHIFDLYWSNFAQDFCPFHCASFRKVRRDREYRMQATGLRQADSPNDHSGHVFLNRQEMRGLSNLLCWS